MTEQGTAKITRKTSISAKADMWGRCVELFHWEVETPDTIFSCLSPDEAFDYLKGLGYEPSLDSFKLSQGRYEIWWFDFIEPEPEFINWIEVAASVR